MATDHRRSRGRFAQVGKQHHLRRRRRVNLIQAGFVDTAPATSYFADEAAVEARREELRATLPIRRVVGPADLAALAVHLMTDTAITGATYDIDGGRRLLA